MKLRTGQFCHKLQTLEQAINQSNFINILQKQHQLFSKDFKYQDIRITNFKDDPDTRIWLVHALIHFNSFKNKSRLLYNKFRAENLFATLELITL